MNLTKKAENPGVKCFVHSWVWLLMVRDYAKFKTSSNFNFRNLIRTL